MRRLGRALCLGSILFITANGRPTAHIFVRNDQGVWLASDSLIMHGAIDGTVTTSHDCKVAISRGRLIFNTGDFRDIRELISQEAALPFDDIDYTLRVINQLMKTNHMDFSHVPDHLSHVPAHLSNETGVIQVVDSKFQAEWFSQGEDRKMGQIYEVKPPFTIGQPHGFGEVWVWFNSYDKDKPQLEAKIAANPKKALLEMMREEAIMRNGDVGGPFTVLLLHPDGTVSDYSDQPLCEIPANAAHIQ